MQEIRVFCSCFPFCRYATFIILEKKKIKWNVKSGNVSSTEFVRAVNFRAMLVSQAAIVSKTKGIDPRASLCLTFGFHLTAWSFYFLRKDFIDETKGASGRCSTKRSVHTGKTNILDKNGWHTWAEIKDDQWGPVHAAASAPLPPAPLPPAPAAALLLPLPLMLQQHCTAAIMS